MDSFLILAIIFIIVVLTIALLAFSPYFEERLSKRARNMAQLSILVIYIGLIFFRDYSRHDPDEDAISRLNAPEFLDGHISSNHGLAMNGVLVYFEEMKDQVVITDQYGAFKITNSIEASLHQELTLHIEVDGNQFYRVGYLVGMSPEIKLPKRTIKY
ncbi:MAG: hypothetical protein AAFX87_31245 [Bacteroidota bacterium]